MSSRLLVITALLALCGCASVPSPVRPSPHHDDGLSRATIGQTVAVGGPKVTPLSVIEDSRCPKDVRCVWAGRVRIAVRIDLGRGSATRELTQGTPLPVADGTLELVEVRSDKPASGRDAVPQGAYRLGFRFMGGL